MTVRGVVTDNLGYALLGGPVLGGIVALVGIYLFGPVAGIGCGVIVYGLGWGLSIRQSDRGARESRPESDETRSRREGKVEAEKSAYGGNGGGG